MRVGTCVIGGGPAGMTVAGVLAAAGEDVLLVEAGGHAYDRTDRANLSRVVADHVRGAQSGLRGRNTGQPYFLLRFAGARGLAGSSNALKGHGLRARPLDPIDFGSRHGAAWPIDYAEMSACLDDAMRRCGIDDAVDWDPRPAELHGAAARTILAAPLRHGDRLAFPNQSRRLEQLGVRVLLHATVTSLMTRRNRVVSARVHAGDRGPMTIDADRFVIATSGIGVARLLLASFEVLDLMGPAARRVGCGFMEHPHLPVGHVVPHGPEEAVALAELFGPGDAPRNVLTLTDDEVQREGLYRAGFVGVAAGDHSLDRGAAALRSLMTGVPYGPWAFGPRVDELRRLVGAAPVLAPAVVRRLAAQFSDTTADDHGGQHDHALHNGHAVQNGHADRNGHGPPVVPAVFGLHAMTEQAPEVSSRVTLSTRRDRSGLRLAELHWVVPEAERRSLERSVALLGEEVERLGWGRVVPSGPAAGGPFEIVRGGWHQIGTAAMATDPCHGVVDPDCRVFGTDNLYVAGSAVFPTSGYANPTLTLVALAVRLGHHLAASGPAVTALLDDLDPITS